MSKPAHACLTCYGTGEAATENGPRACPDCFGEGLSRVRGAKLEWRLREIEHAYRQSGETESDLSWLVHELRSCREALVRILARCQDADDSDALARDVKYQANEALGVYDPS